MKTSSRPVRFGAVIAAALTGLVAMATPASAATHSYDLSMESGRLTFGVTMDLPGSWATGCTPPPVGSVALAGTIDDVTGDIAGTLAMTPLFSLPAPFAGKYALIATGTGTGTYNATTGTFSGFAFTTVAFTIKNVVGTGAMCAPGTTVLCSGTASLTFGGGLYNGATLPLTTSEKVYVNATGTITSRPACSFPFNQLLTVGGPISVSDNPNDDVAPTGTDPGAILHQV